jgi:hypothetical protein
MRRKEKLNAERNRMNETQNGRKKAGS